MIAQREGHQAVLRVWQYIIPICTTQPTLHTPLFLTTLNNNQLFMPSYNVGGAATGAPVGAANLVSIHSSISPNYNSKLTKSTAREPTRWEPRESTGSTSRRRYLSSASHCHSDEVTVNSELRVDVRKPPLGNPPLGNPGNPPGPPVGAATLSSVFSFSPKPQVRTYGNHQMGTQGTLPVHLWGTAGRLGTQENRRWGRTLCSV
jgi:hypothetical protein